jgi:hypothetical protein
MVAARRIVRQHFGRDHHAFDLVATTFLLVTVSIMAGCTKSLMACN